MFRTGRVGGISPHRHRRHHHNQPAPPPPPPPPVFFHLLLLTIVSAQDLKPTCNKTRAYAQAWIDPNYKLRTRVDRIGRTNPTWNDRFIFRVNSDFLRSDTAAVTIDIKRTSIMGLRPDPVIGTARLVLSAVKSSPVTRFVAVQVRRPKSLRPQGILNLGVAVCSEIEAAREFFVDRAMSLRKKGEGSERGAGAKEVGSWAVDKERKALQLKLEKWRTEISPAIVDPDSITGKKERRERLLGCFSGGRRNGD